MQGKTGFRNKMERDAHVIGEEEEIYSHVVVGGAIRAVPQRSCVLFLHLAAVNTIYKPMDSGS